MQDKIKKYWFDLTSGIKKMFKEFFDKETNKKQRANMWSFSRLILLVPILICAITAIITSAPVMFISTSVLVVLGEITDIFDGASARKHKSTSEFGKLLDQLVDKTFSTITTLVLTIINPLSISILLGEIMIGCSNVFYKLKYKEIPDTSSLIGKVKQFPLSAAFIMGFLSPINSSCQIISVILIIITNILQTITAVGYLDRNQKWVKNKKKKNQKKEILLKEEENNTYEKQLQKNIGENNNFVFEKTNSKKDLYINLRNLLNEIIASKQNEESNNLQITKK